MPCYFLLLFSFQELKKKNNPRGSPEPNAKKPKPQLSQTYGFVFFMCIHLIGRKVVLFWLGYESEKRVFLLIATIFISGMSLRELRLFNYLNKNRKKD